MVTSVPCSAWRIDARRAFTKEYQQHGREKQQHAGDFRGQVKAHQADRINGSDEICEQLEEEQEQNAIGNDSEIIGAY